MSRAPSEILNTGLIPFQLVLPTFLQENVQLVNTKLFQLWFRLVFLKKRHNIFCKCSRIRIAAKNGYINEEGKQRERTFKSENSHWLQSFSQPLSQCVRPVNNHFRFQVNWTKQKLLLQFPISFIEQCDLESCHSHQISLAIKTLLITRINNPYFCSRKPTNHNDYDPTNACGAPKIKKERGQSRSV